MANKNAVTLRIPASTSNLGSGFDTLGLALNLYGVVRVEKSRRSGVKLKAAPGNANSAAARHLVTEAACAFFRLTGVPAFGIVVELSGDVPVGRGLGASAIARLGVVAGLSHLSHAHLNSQQLLEIVARLEGHPDNASPAIFGGFTVAGFVKNSVRLLRFPVSSRLRFITLFPRFEINTEEARKLVPSTFSKSDTAHGLNRSALIVAAFASGNYLALRDLFDDRIHQPFREALLPQLPSVIRAGVEAGAIGGWLSGSGSAIMCVAERGAALIARAMQSQLPESDIKVLRADNGGHKVQHS